MRSRLLRRRCCVFSLDLMQVEGFDALLRDDERALRYTCICPCKFRRALYL